MSLKDGEAMRAAVALSIGRDSVYLTAADEVRHFDPISLTVWEGGKLIMVCIKAGVWLWGAVKKKAPEAGEKVVEKGLEAVADRLLKLVSGKSGGGEDKESLGKQAEQLDLAAQALKELGKEAEPEYIASFLAAGEEAVRKQLMAESFPEAKARRIAATVTLQVEMRMKGDAA